MPPTPAPAPVPGVTDPEQAWTLEKEGLLHFVGYLKSRNAQLVVEVDALRSEGRGRARGTAEGGEGGEGGLGEEEGIVKALRSDKEALEHELRSLRLERKGWEMERRRVGEEVRVLEARVLGLSENGRGEDTPNSSRETETETPVRAMERTAHLEEQLAQIHTANREIEEKLLVASTELVDERRAHLGTTQNLRAAKGEIQRLAEEFTRAQDALAIAQDALARAQQGETRAQDSLAVANAETASVKHQLAQRNAAYEALQADLRRRCGAGESPIRKRIKIEPNVPTEVPLPPAPGPQPLLAQRLTPEIHTRIAGFLAGANAYASLAAYNVVDRGVREVTMPVLWEVVMMDRPETVPRGSEGEGKAGGSEGKGKGEGKGEGGGFGGYGRDGGFVRGWQYTRYLILSTDHRDALQSLIHRSPTYFRADPATPYLLHAFPDLRAQLSWSLSPMPSPAAEPRNAGELEIYGAVDSRVLNGLLRKAYVFGLKRNGKGSRKGKVEAVTRVWCSPAARITHGTLVSKHYWNRHAHGLELVFDDDGRGKEVAGLLDQLLRFTKGKGGMERQVVVQFPRLGVRGVSAVFTSLRDHALWDRSDWRFEATLHKSPDEPDHPTPTALRNRFTTAINSIARLWRRFPEAQPHKVDAEGHRVPLFRLSGMAQTGLKVELTVFASPNRRVKALNAHIRAYEEGGRSVAVPGVTCSASYPAEPAE